MLADVLIPGAAVVLHLADGKRFAGTVAATADGWVRFDGGALVNLAHVAAIVPRGAETPPPAADSGPDDDDDENVPRPLASLPRPVPAEAPLRAGPAAPGRAWNDDDLKAVVEGFLDGRPDGALAERFHRTRPQITAIRQGWECARGNAVEDQISATARSWVPRLRRLLSRR
jgi:hypothetical protein